MNRLWWVIGTLLTLALVAFCFRDWNAKRVSCEGRHGVLARTLTGYECAEAVNIVPRVIDCKVGEYIAYAGDCEKPRKWPNCKGGEVIDGATNCRTPPEDLPIGQRVFDEETATAKWGTVEGFCRADQLSERGACEVTKFVPDLPERMVYVDTGAGGITGTLFLANAPTSLFLANFPTESESVTFQPQPPTSINISKDYLNCLYYDGYQVTFLIYANGRRVRVPCTSHWSH